ARLTHRYAGFARELAEQRVAGRDARIGGGDADERLLQVGILQPKRVQERAVRRAIEPLNRDSRRQLLRHLRSRGQLLRIHGRFLRCWHWDAGPALPLVLRTWPSESGP